MYRSRVPVHGTAKDGEKATLPPNFYLRETLSHILTFASRVPSS